MRSGYRVSKGTQRKLSDDWDLPGETSSETDKNMKYIYLASPTRKYGPKEVSGNTNVLIGVTTTVDICQELRHMIRWPTYGVGARRRTSSLLTSLILVGNGVVLTAIPSCRTSVDVRRQWTLEHQEDCRRRERSSDGGTLTSDVSGLVTVEQRVWSGDPTLVGRARYTHDRCRRWYRFRPRSSTRLSTRVPSAPDCSRKASFHDVRPYSGGDETRPTTRTTPFRCRLASHPRTLRDTPCSVRGGPAG